MNLIEIHKKFNSEKKCLDYLEKLRWNGKRKCAHCGSENIRYDQGEGRYACNECHQKFTVKVGTIFDHTRYPLRAWFKAITLILNAKQGISAANIKRNMGCTYKTAWYLAMRVRCAMVDDCIHLQNIVEFDESYVGGKPRKAYKNASDNRATLSQVSTENKRGRGTKKAKIVGVVERNGQVVLRVVEQINSKILLKMLHEYIDKDNTMVMTDEFRAYKAFDKFIERIAIDHSKGFSKGIVHINTIEGFWTIVKNSIRGQYIAISRKYLPFYLVQAQYIYNRRNATHDLFEEFMRSAVSERKPFLYYKPVRKVNEIVYRQKPKGKC